jgi:hypothetical protein
MKRFVLVGLLALGAALAAQGTLKLTVNGQAAAPAIVVNGRTYLPLDALEKAGVRVKRSSGALAVTLPGNLSGAGGTMERASLEGCVNEQLFNGVWRVKVLKLEVIKKDETTPGWGLTIEVKNGSRATIMPVDAGVNGTGEGIQLAFSDATTLSVDPLDVQKVTFASLPPGGSVTWQLKFYYPFGTAENKVQKPVKFLFEVDPKGIGDSTRARGVAFSVPNPSLRVRLDCQK